MYFKAKRNVNMTNHITGGSWHPVILTLIKKNNIYKGEYSPKMYDPNTFQPVINLIITCEDGKSRKFNPDDFYSLEEWREIQLCSILDK
jgi:hypothetical protein